MLTKKDVIYTNCNLYVMLPIQSVLWENTDPINQLLVNN